MSISQEAIDAISFGHSLGDNRMSYKDVLNVLIVYNKLEVQTAAITPEIKEKLIENYKVPSKNIKEDTPPWNKTEIEALIQGINLFGFNKWIEIRNFFSEVLDPNLRTWMDLRNKWLSMEKEAKYLPKR